MLIRVNICSNKCKISLDVQIVLQRKLFIIKDVLCERDISEREREQESFLVCIYLYIVATCHCKKTCTYNVEMIVKKKETKKLLYKVVMKLNKFATYINLLLNKNLSLYILLGYVLFMWKNHIKVEILYV